MLLLLVVSFGEWMVEEKASRKERVDGTASYGKWWQARETCLLPAASKQELVKKLRTYNVTTLLASVAM